MSDRLPFYSACVNWPPNDLEAFDAMRHQARGLTRRTFLQRVNRDDLRDLERQCGYDRDFSMSRDAYVSYHRSKLHGRTVYYFCWSAIEFVFHDHSRCGRSE